MNRLYLMLAGMLILFAAVVGQIFYIQNVKGAHYIKLAKESNIRQHVIKARRGNILAEDGSLLATTVTKYTVSIDPSVPSDKLFDENIDALSDSIYRVFGAKTKYYYANKLTKAKKQGKKYVRLKSNLTFDEYQRMRNFPILSRGRFKGGLIVEEDMKREHPLGRVAERTIGYEKDYLSVGLEGAYSGALTGKDGSVLSVRLQKGTWKPLSGKNEIDPQDGADIYSTIDVHIQDVAHFALLRQLEHFKADHGTVVVMEVKTGKIKAIVNLGRTENGKYYEKVNYAVFESAEPGSTFKLPALIAALEDGVVDTSDVVDTGNGRYKVYNRYVTDAKRGGYGKLTVKQVLEHSSNIGMAKIINENYKDEPQKFLRRLYSMGLDKKIGFKIKGEGEPVIPSPLGKGWSGTSLAWMAHGYGVHLTPLQILTFYNAIANNGVEVKPYFVSKIRDDQRVLHTVQTEIRNPRICSERVVGMAQDMLEGVVKEGTGQFLKMDNLPIAGKTGTAQLEYWKGKKGMGYSSSFVGYFPVEDPRYSMIVVVNRPDKNIGYYGATVAGPVFKEIAVKIYHEGPEVKNTLPMLDTEELKNSIASSKKEVKYRKGLMPNVRGIPAMDALAILENIGLKVKMTGTGNVVRQSIPAGRRIKKNNQVNLVLM